MNQLILEKGNKGQEVSRIQSVLGVKADGIFGPATEAAVKDFNAKAGIILYPEKAGWNTQLTMRNPVLSGIDVSHHNGVIDARTFLSDPPAFVYIKATEGRTHTDTRMAENATLCECTGIPYGFYHFGRPDTDMSSGDAVAEVSHFVNATKNFRPTLRPVLDLEAGVKTDDSYNAVWALAYAKRIQEVLGKEPIIYTAKWYYDTYLRDGNSTMLTELAKMDLWLASYNEGASPDRAIPIWKEWLIWQWTAKSTQAGIKGNVDRNWLSGGQFSRLVG